MRYEVTLTEHGRPMTTPLTVEASDEMAAAMHVWTRFADDADELCVAGLGGIVNGQIIEAHWDA